MRILARGYLMLIAVAFAAIGLVSLANPTLMAAKFDLLPQSAKATTELRSLYGGAFISWSVGLGLALGSARLAPGILLSMAMAMGGIGVVRLASVFIDHGAIDVPAILFEALTALACVVLYRLSPPPAAPE